MHLLINLAVIRLSLQIVIPGITIVFKRQREHQHPSLLSLFPATTPTACDGWHRKCGKGHGSDAFRLAGEQWAYGNIALGMGLV